ncbi:MAG: contact-dependent growth inhibition system immunity protein [Paraburkholderia sp.]
MYEIFGAYLNQDYDRWGTTIRQIVSCYKEDSSREYHHELINEINSFVNEHPTDLDSAFEKKYDTGFSPKWWGYTTQAFFEELKRLLRE